MGTRLSRQMSRPAFGTHSVLSRAPSPREKVEKGVNVQKTRLGHRNSLNLSPSSVSGFLPATRAEGSLPVEVLFQV